jgi:hypothetical protein
MQNGRRDMKLKIVIGAVAVAAYVSLYAYLSLNGGYILTQSGQVRSGSHLVSDIQQWQPYHAFCQRFWRADGSWTLHANLPGYVFAPMIILDQTLFHREKRGGEKTTLIDGSCEHARPLGGIRMYERRVQARNSSLGYIRIRSDATWSGVDAPNLLGKVPAGSLLWAEGPLKDAKDPGGLCFAVAVRDKEGRFGRGYVSVSVVDVVP